MGDSKERAIAYMLSRTKKLQISTIQTLQWHHTYISSLTDCRVAVW